MTSLLLLIVGVFLGGLGFGVAIGWWMRGEMWLAHQVTGKTMDFTRRKVGT
jgi:hypothetical protein